MGASTFSKSSAMKVEATSFSKPASATHVVYGYCGDVSGFIPTILDGYAAINVDPNVVDKAALLIRDSLGAITTRVLGERCEPDVAASFANVMRAVPFCHLLGADNVTLKGNLCPFVLSRPLLPFLLPQAPHPPVAVHTCSVGEY